MKEISLTKGYVATVDDDDYEYLSGFSWHAGVSANGKVVYAHSDAINQDGVWRTVRMHRLIMNAPSNVMVDHIDGDGLNNMKSNLRLCTNAENKRDQHTIYGKSKYKGVFWEKSNSKWRARIKANGKKLCLGCYINEIDAANAYDNAAIRYFGEYARVNVYEQLLN